MRTCPKCGKHELDVTVTPNNYKCWNCDFFCIGKRNLLKAYIKYKKSEEAEDLKEEIKYVKK